VPSELGGIAKAFRDVGQLDALFVSGGGQIDDSWGGPWHHPYTLLLWTALARLRRRPAAFLSVGAGPASSRLSRVFFRRALSLASYRSYRDEDSLRFVQDVLGFAAQGSVVPDMAFALPLPAGHADFPVRHGAHPVVALSPMCYADPRVWPEPDAAVYEAYIQRLAELSAGLLARGFDVRFFLGEAATDVPPIRDLIARLEETLPADQFSRVSAAYDRTVDELLATLEDADFVISSRYHGVVLSQLLARPILAISHHPKVRSVMADAGLSEFCLDIERFTLEESLTAFDRLVERSGEVTSTLADARERRRSAVEHQFELVLADLLPAAAARGNEAVAPARA
jgi:polysaccharide pyruvyl transferase WcaK-like protein